MLVEATFDEKGAYTIVLDGRPVAPGGGPLPDPPVLFLGGLGACAGLYAVRYLQARGLPFAGLRVRTESTYVDNPRRLGDVRIKVLLPAPVEDRHIGPLQRSIELCTLKNSLACPPNVATELAIPAAAA
jgi:ribosomal protein S12 methylthiotransferase accessory factor